MTPNNPSQVSWARGVWPVLLLLAAAIFIRTHLHAEVLPPYEHLASFPGQVGPWTGSPLAIPPGDLEVLGPGHFMEKVYRAPGKASVDLFIAFFPKQTTGDTIHSPKHCLPGAGWTALYSRTVHVPWGNGRVLNANEYAMELGSSREMVLYWFQSHGRTVASEYWAKFYLVADSLRMNRTDGALVRVITPLGRHESLDSGEGRALAFTRLVLPLLRRFIPN
jgi:EpsI family protein